MMQVVASLEVGYPEGGLPEVFSRYRGRVARSIGRWKEFPFEDSQFDVVMMEGSMVSAETVKEAHRVLKPSGRLFFIVPEKTNRQEGVTLPEIYSMVCGGFDITELQRPEWWRFGRSGRKFTVCATKKNWKSIERRFRPYV